MRSYPQDEILIMPYCAPQPEYTYKGEYFPSRITEEQFRLLKNCGINMVMGHEDMMNSPTEAEAFKAMDICHKLGMKYLVKDYLFYEYYGTRDGHTHFNYLTEEEREDLDRRMEASLRRYKDHPAFAGVLFIDEVGLEGMDGVARGQAVFNRVCPGKIFLATMFPMYSSPKCYQHGWADLDVPFNEKILPYKQENLDRFKYYMEQWLDKVSPEILNYDLYPYAKVEEAPNAVHQGMWDMTQYVTGEARKLDKEYWHTLQCGGRWCDDMRIRITNMGEVNLGISVALGYGAQALILYTGCFPNCCYGGIEHSGIIDIHGNITEQYPLYQYAFMQVKAIGKYLLNAKLKAMVLSDAPYFGMLPDHEVIQEVEDRDKGAGKGIFEGGFHRYGNIMTDSYGALKKIESTSQAIVSCFEKEGETFYFLFNTSPYAATDVTLTFDDEYTYEYTQRTVTDTSEGSTLTIHALPAGENVLIRLMKNKQ